MQNQNLNPPREARERLIVALDVPSASDALGLVDSLADAVVFYKVGLELFTAAGMEVVRALRRRGKRCFLDLKLFDIGETVARAVAVVAREQVDFLTVHGEEQVMQAAALGREGSTLQVLAVTVLTSLDQQDLRKMGVTLSVEALALQRAKAALACGCAGVIASAMEAQAIKRATGGKLLVFCPGIRPAESGADDQKRIATPAFAIANGADYLVVGRPITRSSNPQASARALVAEMEEAFSKRT